MGDIIIDTIKEQIAFHKAELQRLERLLGEVMKLPLPKEVKEASLIHQPRKTLEDTVLEILSDGIPRTSRELLNEYTKKTEKEMAMPFFSARLVGLQNKKSIEKQAFPENPIQTRNYYGKHEWFVKGKLKPEYLAKIK